MNNWFENYGFILALAKWLNENDYFKDQSKEKIFEFFEKPWRYEKEWQKFKNENVNLFID